MCKMDKWRECLADARQRHTEMAFDRHKNPFIFRQSGTPKWKQSAFRGRRSIFQIRRHCNEWALMQVIRIACIATGHAGAPKTHTRKRRHCCHKHRASRNPAGASSPDKHRRAGGPIKRWTNRSARLSYRDRRVHSNE